MEPATANDDRGTVIVTGASGGIGYELAKLFARDRWPLLLTARSDERLKAVAAEFTAAHGGPVATCALDLAEPHTAPQLVQAARALGRPIEILVNNAGFGSYGPFAETDPTTLLQMLQLNVVALTQLTRLVLPDMLARQRGRIMNVASTAAFQPGPLMAVYYATKAYVLHFTEALADELRQTGVSATAFCPGPTATGFERRANLEASKLFTGRRVMAADVATEVGYQGLLQGRRIVVPGLWNQLMVQGHRLLPRNWATALVRHVQERRDAGSSGH
jgi:short-subunit dehydrogenase